ncbi:MAG: hypothetical protein COV69_02810 [Parcubacteria group bacterium CG11_big_fil_rev_8_21_14_0_20_39_14]|nr:MAG: hypothetical protein COV69_02810 [Parcubacteria group bacterium CG11_big_fil_rev_8_21_14_0_20_39_14]PIS35197.1 MAG: hypothetical protein COT36_03645 [Parcubacteria group bacterium CG08_land_8_20_14_0_20_38_56]
MGIRFGPFDPLQLLFEVMNVLMRKGYLTFEEAREIVKKSLPPEMPNEDKEKLLDSLIKKID